MINSDYFTEYDKTKTDVAYGLQSINKFNESQNDTLSSVQLLGRNNLRQSNKICFSLHIPSSIFSNKISCIDLLVVDFLNFLC